MGRRACRDRYRDRAADHGEPQREGKEKSFHSELPGPAAIAILQPILPLRLGLNMTRLG
jgi:hypothetical protein